jgi:putative autoinducer-2 (AI-2) aldolase
MPDVDERDDGLSYGIGIPAVSTAFPVKGSNALDWGMKNRLGRLFPGAHVGS